MTWQRFSYAAIFGNYLLMFFYTTVSGWMLAYLVKISRGSLTGLSPDQIGAEFGSFISDPAAIVGWMILVCVLGFGICSRGLASGVERSVKIMMPVLFIVLGILAIRSITFPGAGEGLKFYLAPSLSGIREHGLGRVIFAAMSQSFFTLSLGIGSMTIFGSYVNKDRGLFGEALTVTALSTCTALISGLVIFPLCFAQGINPGSDPGLVFVTMPVVFNSMPLGQLWGVLFFTFMVLAALSTVIAVFENLIAFVMELSGISRGKACLINFFVVVLFSLPCALGFSVLSGITLMGGVLDMEDFILSHNLLPLGAIIYCLFVTHKSGWGWDNFLKETNSGTGPKFPAWLKSYVAYGIPLIAAIIFVMGYIDIFG
jgi:NSS family neurotransmitter:Na+ symporter